jgi:hypothetical protein
VVPPGPLRHALARMPSTVVRLRGPREADRRQIGGISGESMPTRHAAELLRLPFFDVNLQCYVGNVLPCSSFLILISANSFRFLISVPLQWGWVAMCITVVHACTPFMPIPRGHLSSLLSRCSFVHGLCSFPVHTCEDERRTVPGGVSQSHRHRTTRDSGERAVRYRGPTVGRVGDRLYRCARARES